MCMLIVVQDEAYSSATEIAVETLCKNTKSPLGSIFFSAINPESVKTIATKLSDVFYNKSDVMTFDKNVIKHLRDFPEVHFIKGGDICSLNYSI